MESYLFPRLLNQDVETMVDTALAFKGIGFTK
jgi:hypothetical protein